MKENKQNKKTLCAIVAGLSITALAGCTQEGKVVNKQYLPARDYQCTQTMLLPVGDNLVPFFYDDTCHENARYILTLQDGSEFTDVNVGSGDFNQYKIGDKFSRTWPY